MCCIYFNYIFEHKKCSLKMRNRSNSSYFLRRSFLFINISSLHRDFFHRTQVFLQCSLEASADKPVNGQVLGRVHNLKKKVTVLI